MKGYCGEGGWISYPSELLRETGSNVLGFTDANSFKWGSIVSGFPVIGGDEEIFKISSNKVAVAIGLGSTGDNNPRRLLFEKFFQKGYSIPPLVHPKSVVAKSSILGNGSLVMAGAIIQTRCCIGNNVIVNTGAIVDHDCHIGDHCHLAPGVTLSGNVTVGSGTHIGTGASIIQNIRIGHAAIVAAGAVVINDVLEMTTVVGVPAKKKPHID